MANPLARFLIGRAGGACFIVYLLRKQKKGSRKGVNALLLTLREEGKSQAGDGKKTEDGRGGRDIPCDQPRELPAVGV